MFIFAALKLQNAINMAKRRLFLFALMIIVSSSCVCVNAGNPRDVNLDIVYNDPDTGQPSNQRAPILIPHVGIDDYTLTFYTPCDGCTLQLLDENGYVSFVTVIPVGTSSLILPSYLSGIYQIRIIQGNICFWGYIDL